MTDDWTPPKKNLTQLSHKVLDAGLGEVLELYGWVEKEWADACVVGATWRVVDSNGYVDTSILEGTMIGEVDDGRFYVELKCMVMKVHKDRDFKVVK